MPLTRQPDHKAPYNETAPYNSAGTLQLHYKMMTNDIIYNVKGLPTGAGYLAYLQTHEFDEITIKTAPSIEELQSRTNKVNKKYKSILKAPKMVGIDAD